MSATLSPEKKSFLKYWAIGISIIYILIAILVVYIVQGEKSFSNKNHALRMDPNAVEPGKTPPDPLPKNTDFKTVNVGIYLDGIENLSILDSYWTPTFYIWFRWKGDKSLNPGKYFRLVDGKIEKQDLQDSYSAPDGTNYELYKVVAKVSKFFNTTRVPLDDHMLNIYIEDSTNDVRKMRYVADSSSGISSRVKIPGYNITGMSTVVKPHTYKTSYGDPRVAEGARTTFSEYNYGVTIKRNNIGVFLKLFVGLYAGVLLTICSFYIHPSDTGSRFALPSASYFGVIANAYMTTSLLPPSGYFGLADLVTSIGLFTITLCVIASLISVYCFLQKNEKEFSRQVDKVSRRYITVGFIAVNILLPVCAFY
ncbi:hypothetical protein [Polynucleobacter sp. MWH-Braz-FAM2G]|uniref:hypothetical protein n=1 Tax=Polynucleobacter sp. MWH-Braz-FAM2G TaxID=1855883 RepID=UPI001BFECB26|nr:hypothetical protein [Polynucleobacter sp. MWH-Braz-FAM2G]QWD91488.1 hypothetical protein FD973_03930 [Polynucleobacter sp. MWH-Braz-FAM2G]